MEDFRTGDPRAGEGADRQERGDRAGGLEGRLRGQVPARRGRARGVLLAEGVACYRNFLRGLLDLTDNLVQGAVVLPADVVRHDEDDPYLVVAADKGTASFSDYANQVSAEYGFWLADAFASGGSVGYDHKKMGITRAAPGRRSSATSARWARTSSGALQRRPASATCRAMLGNGMPCCRSRSAWWGLRTTARSIFIDPDPDPARSWDERARMSRCRARAGRLRPRADFAGRRGGRAAPSRSRCRPRRARRSTSGPRP